MVNRDILDGRQYLRRSTVVSGRVDGMCDFAARNLFCTYVLCTYSCDAYEYIFHHLLTSITERRNEVISYEVEYCRLILYNNIVKLKVVQYHRLKYMHIYAQLLTRFYVLIQQQRGRELA